MSGKVVYTTDGNITSGTHEFTWDGKDANGNQLEDGAYQIIVSPKVNGGEAAATVTTTVFGRVTGVASDGNNVYIGLGDAVTASLSDILTMRDDDYFNKIGTTYFYARGKYIYSQTNTRRNTQK